MMEVVIPRNGHGTALGSGGTASLHATEIDLGQLKPDTAFSSSRYDLPGKPTNTWSIFRTKQRQKSDLSGVSGLFRVSWLDTATGSKQEGDVLNGGTSLVLESPFKRAGSIVHLRKE